MAVLWYFLDMRRLDPELEQVLDERRKRLMVRLVEFAGGGAPYWEIEDGGVLCLTWERGDRDVVMLIPEKGRPVLYRGRVRVADAGGVELADAIRWMRGGSGKRLAVCA